MQKKEEMFRRIIVENERKIQGICRYYSASQDDFQDMVQEVLINIWKSLDSFKGKAQISTWIYRVAVNTAISFLNKEIRRQKIFLNMDDNNLQNLVDADESQSLAKEKMFEALENQVNQLSVIDKIIISLVLEKVPLKEIAEVIGITEPNARVKVHRIKSELKKALQNV